MIELKICPLCDDDDLSSFFCADADLGDFLKNDAKSYQEKMLGRTYLCTYENKLVGFMTLCMDVIKADVMQKGDKIEDVEIKSYPALKIARLGVKKSFERRGIGTYLVDLSIGKARELSMAVGCRLIIVDSKPNAISFYKKLEFKLMEKPQKRKHPLMYLDLYEPVV